MLSEKNVTLQVEISESRGLPLARWLLCDMFSVRLMSNSGEP